MKLLNYLSRFFFSTKYRARREAMDEHDKILTRIRFAITMPRIYDLQDEVLDYHNTWASIIDYETLDILVGPLWAAIYKREAAVQSERKRAYTKTIYN